ncbi:hypothetical protein C2G38_1197615 [Gigaspora rosea]|uniref:Uncharacterized protein n=1 Tax=Gigaspora rosea TaxID=44941 RepID=A0A397VF27_9GLOM|nr:hypothetical protein C2G38_1197615 [Gigaspora rosea]
MLCWFTIEAKIAKMHILIFLLFIFIIPKNSRAVLNHDQQIKKLFKYILYAFLCFYLISRKINMSRNNTRKSKAPETSSQFFHEREESSNSLTSSEIILIQPY